MNWFPTERSSKQKSRRFVALVFALVGLAAISISSPQVASAITSDVCAVQGTNFTLVKSGSGSSSYCTLTFTSSGSFTVPNNITALNYLLVGGGGGGSGSRGGGGGSGGVGTLVGHAVSANSLINVVVGAGGSPNSNGQDTYFTGSKVAGGGGAGGSFGSNGAAANAVSAGSWRGSGGGAGTNYSDGTYHAATGGAGTYSGGSSGPTGQDTERSSGGGGGAGSSGGTSDGGLAFTTAAVGGISSGTYGGGGGGSDGRGDMTSGSSECVFTTAGPGAGGSGLGGNGGKASIPSGACADPGSMATAGAANTGSGGGGGPSAGANGGSGLVVISFALPTATVSVQNQTLTYGSSSPTTHVVKDASNAVIAGDSLATFTYEGTGTTLYSPSTQKPTAVGTYSVTPSVLTNSSSSLYTGYSLSYQAGTLTINPLQLSAPANVTAEVPQALGAVDVSWSAVANANGYKIRYTYPVLNGPLQVVEVSLASNVTSYRLTNLDGASSHYFFVSALGDGTNTLTSPEAIDPTNDANNGPQYRLPKIAQLAPDTPVISANANPVLEGNTVTLSVMVAVATDGQGSVTGAWQKKQNGQWQTFQTVPLIDQDGDPILPVERCGTYTPTYTPLYSDPNKCEYTYEYETPVLQASDDGTEYRFVADVTGSYVYLGSFQSASAAYTLSVTPLVARPTISSQPVGLTTTAGRGAQFTVSANTADAGTLSYQWYKGVTPLTDSANMAGTTSSTLTLSNLSTVDAGDYSVTVTNSLNGSTSSLNSSVASLVVNPALAFRTWVLSSGNRVGRSFSFDASVNISTGTGPYTYSIATQSGTPATLLTGISGFNISSTGQITGQIGIDALVSPNVNRFTITATDSTGASATKTVEMLVNGTAAVNTGDRAVDSLATPVITVAKNDGVLKSLIVTWNSPGAFVESLISNYSIKVYPDVAKSSTTCSIPNLNKSLTTYTILPSTCSAILDSRQYWVTLTANSADATKISSSSASSLVSATTETPAPSPTISSTLPATTYANESTTVTLSVSATSASGEVRYQWYKGGTLQSGQTANSLSVTSKAGTGSDIYMVKVTNWLNGIPSVETSITTTLQSVSFTINSYGVSALAGWTVNSPITHSANAQVWGSGSGEVLTFSITSGTLPAGVSFSQTTGVFSGTPTEAVTSRSLTVQTTSTKTGLTYSTTFTINVARMNQQALTLTLGSTKSLYGTSSTISVTVSGGSGTGDYLLGIANSTSSTCKLNGGTAAVTAVAGENQITISSNTFGNFGTCSVTLSKNSDAIYNAATQVSRSFQMLYGTDTPGSFAAVASGSKSFTLSWTNLGPTKSSTVSYRIGIYTSSGTQIRTVAISSASTLSKVLTSTDFPEVADGTIYRFDIVSVGSGQFGESPPSAQLSVASHISAATPSVTSSTSGTQSVVGGNTATFAASGSTSDSGILSYQWQVSTSADNYSTWSNVTSGTGGNSDSYTSAALGGGTLGYKFRLKVTNTLNGPDVSASSVAYSNDFAVTVQGAPQVISFANPGNKVFGSGSFTVAPSTDASGLTVVLTSSTTSVCTVSGFTVAIVSAGTCTLLADQIGDSSYAAATQVSQSFTIAKKVPTLSAPADMTKTYSTTSTTFALATPTAVDPTGGTWTYVSSNSSVVSVSGSTGLISGAGTAQVTATYTPKASDQANYDSNASVTFNVSVEKAAQPSFTISTDSTTKYTKIWDGIAWSHDAAFNPSGVLGSGPITYSIASASFTPTAQNCAISGTGPTYTVTASSWGYCVITATIAESANHLGATSTRNFYFSRATLALPSATSIFATTGSATSLTVQATPNPNANYNHLRLYKSQADWTAINRVSGRVNGALQSNFYINNSNPFVITGLEPNTTYYAQWTAGSAPTGDPYWTSNATSFANATIVTTNADVPTPTINTISSSSVSKTVGQSLRLSVSATGTGNGSGLAYQWKKNGVPIVGATAADLDIATVTTADAGLYSVTVTDTSNGITSAAATYSETVLVDKANSVVGSLQDLNRTFGDANITLTNPSASPSGGTWSYSSSNSNVATVTGNTISLVGGGTAVINGVYAASDSANYNDANVSFTLTVAKASQTIDFSAISDQILPTGTISVSPTTSAFGLSVTVTSATLSVCTVAGGQVNLIAVGTCTLTASQSGNASFNSATQVSRSFAVSRGALIVNPTLSFTSMPFGGTAPIASFTTSGLAGSDVISGVVFSYTDSSNVTTTSLPSAVGTYVVSISAVTFSAGSGSNYSINYGSLNLTITAQAQTITFPSIADKTFGDSPFSVSATSSSSLTVSLTSSTLSVCSVSGFSISVLAAGTCTITADQAGDTSYSSAPQVSRSFAVNPRAVLQGSVTATAPAGYRKTLTATWLTVPNATGYIVKLYLNGTTLKKTLTVDSSFTSQTFNSATFNEVDSTGYSMMDNAPYKISVTATGTGNYANSTEVFSSTVTTRNIAVVNYNPQVGSGYPNSDFSGTLPERQVFVYGATTPLTVQLNSGNFSRVGYDFLGWNSASDGSGQTYVPGVSTTWGDINLWPMWQLKTHTLTFNSNFGTPSTSAQSFTYGIAQNLNLNAFTRAGYDFNGWGVSSANSDPIVYSDGQSVTVLTATTLYARWRAIDYSVTYSANGGSGTAPTESSKTIGTTFTVKAITGVSRTGFDFGGWTDGTSVYQAGDSYTVSNLNVILTATWVVQSYSISYSTNGATSGSASRTSDIFVYGSNPISLPTRGSMVRTGYTFGGWSASPTGTPMTGNFAATANSTLHAVWVPNTYSITYNSNGASGALARTNDSYVSGTAALVLPGSGTLNKAGHTFVGWSTTATGNSISGGFTTSQDQTLYAVWAAISYSVNYLGNGGSTSATEQNHIIDDSFILAAAPLAPVSQLQGQSYQFAGWSDGQSSYAAGANFTMGASNVTFTAQWIEIYTVHYILNGSFDQASPDVLLSNGASATTAQAPGRRGHTFAGWKDQAGQTIAANTSFTVSINRFVFEAQWQAIPYTVTYDSNGGASTPTESNHIIGDDFAIAAAPSKLGYTFGGWSDGMHTYGVGARYVVDINNVVLTAVWNPIAYRVTYDLGLGTSQTPTQANRNIGQTFLVAAAPVRFGYTFVKWSDGTNLFAAGETYTVASSDIVLTATWVATQLHVNYDLGGMSGAAPTETDKTIGNTFTLAAEPVWLNHDFLGWTDGTTTYAAGSNYTISGNNVTLTALWADVLFSVTYANGGGSGNLPADASLAFGIRFTVQGQGNLSRSGFTFTGWSDGASIYQPGSSYTMAGSDLTFTAVWSPIPAPPAPVNPPAPNPGTPTTPPVPTPEERIVKVSVPVDLKYGSDSKVLLEARSTIGAPLTWKTASKACKVTEDGQLTVLGAGKCVIEVSEVTAAGLTRVIEIPVMPRLDIVLKDASEIKPNSATLNAVVAWPGADFKVKFCVTTSEKSTDCVVNTTITITSENASGTESGALSISRAIAGLKAESTYFVHAAIMVDDIQYVSTAMMLKTPVDPAPVVLNPTITSQPIAVNKTQIVWKNSLVGAEHIVKLAGAIVCRSVTDSCVINQLLGPNAKLQVYVSLANGTLSDSFVPKYIIPAKRIAIATMSYPARTIYLSKSQKLVLARYARTMLAKGFTRIVISQVVELRPATNFLMAKRLEATANYLKTVLKGKTLKVVLYRKLAPSATKPNYSKDVGASARKTIISIR